MRNALANQQKPSTESRPDACSQSIDWYSEGESRLVEVGGVCVEIRFVGRKGRKGRISILAPMGATFRDLEKRDAKRSSNAST